MSNSSGNFYKRHRFNVALVITMIIIDFLVFMNNLSENSHSHYSWVRPASPTAVMIAFFSVNVVMLLPAVLLIVWIYKHRKDTFEGYGDASDTVIGFLKYFFFAFLYFVGFVIVTPAIVFPTMLLSRGNW